MKVVSYNISACSQKKIDQLFKNGADVYVVPEIAREDKIKLSDGFQMKWVGDENFPSKGLGVIWKAGRGSVPEWRDESLHYAIPVFVDGVLIIGIWPTKLDKKETYTQIAKDILDHYSKQIKENKTIVIDFFIIFEARINHIWNCDYIIKFSYMLLNHLFQAIRYTNELICRFYSIY